MSGASGRRLSNFRRGEFIAWDGEGINAGKVDASSVRQDYILLANSLGDSIVKRSGLSTLSCLQFLCKTAEAHPKAIHVIYGGSYDVNMMLRDLPREDIDTLFHSGFSDQSIQYGRYLLQYVPFKALHVRRLRNVKKPFTLKNGKWVLDIDIQLTLWDVIGFFQSTFETAVKNWLSISNDSILSEGKADRANFDKWPLPKIIAYNNRELELLSQLMLALRDACQDIGLELRRWDGAGSIASAMFQKHKIKESLSALPAQVEEASRYAYFGGRIELIKFGHERSEVHYYDINSAYPSALVKLPSLASGEWREIPPGNFDIRKLPALSLLQVSWSFNPGLPFYPFPYRSKVQNKLLFPREGRGWVWLPEAIAAVNNRFAFDVEKIYSFFPFSSQPFRFVHEYYEQRRKLIALNKKGGAEKVIKLGLNSLYGKLAQHVGYNELTGKKPPYHNIALAGWVTSHTRAQLFDAAAKAPESIISFCTDGIFSESSLNVLTSSTKELGFWEHECFDEFVSVQAGVYFSRRENTWYVKMRGFDKLSPDECPLFLAALDRAWLRKSRAVYCPSTRFITAKSALVSDEWWGRWLTWHKICEDGIEGRRLEIWPDGTKRRVSSHHVRPDLGLISTSPELNLSISINGEMPLSEIYSLDWAVTDGTIEGIPISLFTDESEAGGIDND